MTDPTAEAQAREVWGNIGCDVCGGTGFESKGHVPRPCRDCSHAHEIIEAAIHELEAKWNQAVYDRDVAKRDRDKAEAELAIAKQAIDAKVALQAELSALKELVSGAAPLAWVANQDMAGAQEWEKEARALLEEAVEE